MKNNVLSIKQMQKLTEYGIDTSNAKIFWCKQVNGITLNEPINGIPFLTFNKSNMLVGFMRFEYTPTFTLQDMIELMPESFKHDGNIYYLEIHKNSFGYTEYEEYESMYASNEDSIINNAYNTLIWLLENKYI